MKRTSYLAFAMTGIVYISLIIGCSKPTDTTPGGGGGSTVTATLTVQNPPSFPLWNGDNYSFTYSSTNTTGVKINGINSPSSGTINLPGLTKDSTFLFETAAIAGVTNASSQTVTIRVFKLRRTNLCKESKLWKNTYSEYLIGGVWTAIVPRCIPTRFFPTGDTCRIYNSACSALPDAYAIWYFDSNETIMSYAQAPGSLLWGIEKCTKDSLVLLREDGLLRQWHVAF